MWQKRYQSREIVSRMLKEGDKECETRKTQGGSRRRKEVKEEEVNWNSTMKICRCEAKGKPKIELRMERHVIRRGNM
jgi:hypothetical protein